jgi:hypothetical protein
MLIQLPTNFLSDLTGAIGDTMQGLWPIVIFVVAIPFAFYILNKVRALATQGTRGRARGY